MTSTLQNRPVYGLVLSGGKSQRMGQDKGSLQYHGLSQREYLYKLLKEFCPKVYISVRPEQANSLEAALTFLPDSHTVSGPFNGILSAMQKHPEAAWLVVACDMPLVKKETIQKLISERNPNKMATAYALQDSELPEPLLAIWEPAAYETALAFIAETGSCPRKFLLNQEIKLVRPERDEELYNANAPEDLEFVNSRLQHGKIATL